MYVFVLCFCFVFLVGGDFFSFLVFFNLLSFFFFFFTLVSKQFVLNFLFQMFLFLLMSFFFLQKWYTKLI